MRPLRRTGSLAAWGGLVGVTGLLLLWACGGGGGGSAAGGGGTPDTTNTTNLLPCPNFQQSGSEGTPAATASIDPNNNPDHTKPLSVNQAWASTTWNVTDPLKVTWAVVETGGGTVTSPGFAVTYTAPTAFPRTISGTTGFNVTVQATLTSTTSSSVCRTVRIALTN